MDDIVFEETQLRSQLHSKANEESDEESSSENKQSDKEEQSSFNLKNIEFDLDDLSGASLDDTLDTIEGKYESENVAEWLNDIYYDFMKLVIEGNISNKIGDKIIKFFNKHSALD